jgi:cell division septal protein FtsQ
MPQFDKIIFFNQVFWLVFLFFSFYILLVRRYLPIAISAFKMRKKKIVLNKKILSSLKIKNSSLFYELSGVSIHVLISFLGKD